MADIAAVMRQFHANDEAAFGANTLGLLLQLKEA
ncbi:hypothetical protein BJ969_004099 [Saccharopolyspora gloriosae]|uniref:Uncharacterized protein n=1 Tax=Saccharopolyspora gloriosae TaxID=455344 RepID=A0A840NIX6_9PSEU|nr:hypothetical protein [Saccharopolyspora gloriosae]